MRSGYNNNLFEKKHLLCDSETRGNFSYIRATFEKNRPLIFLRVEKFSNINTVIFIFHCIRFASDHPIHFIQEETIALLTFFNFET